MKKDRNCNAGMMPAQGMMVPYPMMGPAPVGVGPVMMSPSMNPSSGCGCGGNANTGCNCSSEINRLKQQINNLERRVCMLENNQPVATPYNNYNNYNDSNVQMI